MKRSKLTVAGWAFAALNVAVAIAEVILTEDGWGGVIRAAVLVVSAALVVGGIRLLGSHPRLGATITSIGALAGGVSLIWLLFPTFLAAAIVWLSVSQASALSTQPQ